MKMVLLAAAALALSVAGVQACDFHKTAHVDASTVASTEADKPPMTTVDEKS